MKGVDDKSMPVEADPLVFVSLWLEANKRLLQQVGSVDYPTLRSLLDSDLLACTPVSVRYRKIEG